MSNIPYVPAVSPESLAQTKALLNELAPWLALAPVNYDQAVQEALASNTSDGFDRVVEISMQLQRLAIHAVRLGIYIEDRGSGIEHSHCVDYANRRVRRVRDVLGFSTLDADDITF